MDYFQGKIMELLVRGKHRQFWRTATGICALLFGFYQIATAQPPDTSDYRHAEVVCTDSFSHEPDGFWLFEPAAPVPAAANVIVFLHGYGGYNPMIYGAWIDHLVRQGNIVIYPRYQRNMMFPSPKKFPENTAQGIRDALELLRTRPTEPLLDHYTYIGHSYGGMIAAILSMDPDAYDLPTPTAALLSAPGTGPFPGLREKSYKKLPKHLQLLVVIHAGDTTVGDKMGRRIFETAKRTKQRNLLLQTGEATAAGRTSDGHNESYAVNPRYDTGEKNFTSRRARNLGAPDRTDWQGYWRLADALIACDRAGERCDEAFGNTAEQRFLGRYEDGTAVREFEVWTPGK